MTPSDYAPGIRLGTWLKWVGLALLGIVIAAGVSVAASSLSSQPIGLTSEPVSAGDQLVSPPARPADRAQSRPPQDKAPPPTRPTSTTPSTVPPQVAPAPSNAEQTEVDNDADD